MTASTSICCRALACTVAMLVGVACGEDPAPVSTVDASDSVAAATADALSDTSDIQTDSSESQADSSGDMAAVPDLADAAADIDPWRQGKSHIAGTAYRFGMEPGPIAGAQIRIAELPEVATLTAADGRYALDVPRGVPVTPWIQHPGYATMHMQTFTFDSEVGPQNVNLQVIPDGYFEAFAAILGIVPDPTRCQISSTVNTKDVFTLERKAFYAYGAHGIAGVQVWAEPDLGPPVYFSAQTIPTRSLTETTLDGGIVWANVPPGVYTVRASHPSKTIAPFVATCTPGRFINAGPPWGLREL